MKRISLFLGLCMALAVPWPCLAEISWHTVPEGGSPLVITSAGQSEGIKIARLLTIRSGLEDKMAYKPLLKFSELPEGHDALLMVVMGFSQGGLTAANLSVTDEMKRVEDVLKKAASQNMTTVAVHIDGRMGRGVSGSDSEKIIDLVLPFASYLVISREGDEDQRFATWAAEQRIPVAWLDDPLELAGYIRAMYSRQ